MNTQKWIERAQQKGFESFEIYRFIRRERSFSWFEGQMDSMTTSRVTGTALRGVYLGRMSGYAMETDINDEDEGAEDETALIERILDSMKEQAAAVTSEEEACILSPVPEEETAGGRIWNRPSVKEIRELLVDLERRILAFDPEIRQVTHLQWGEESTERQIVNSRGLQVQDTGAVQVLSAGAAAIRDTEVKNASLTEVVSSTDNLDRDIFVRRLGEKVLGKLGAGSLPSGRYRVIFDRDAMTALFGAFSDIFSGERISRGLSPLTDRQGEKVFSETITIIDDPRCGEAVSIYNYDDEGHPTYCKIVVKNGAFRTILHSTASAARMGMKSTGNGFKASWTEPVKARPMNCRIEPGTMTLEDMCRDMGEGLVITDLAGLHAGLDHTTGDFSLQCSGYLVKEGKRDRAVSLITVAGNFLELMQSAVEVGSDLDWQYHTIVSPSVAFSGCAVSGSSGE